MHYTEAIQFLYGLGLFGARFGLETTRTLAARAGNPQDQLRFIHVAGTNGKGSTCAMLESIYRAAGFRVGLFTSPHLVSFRERIQVNRQLISEADVVRFTAEMRLWLESFPADTHPTLFEAVTIMALRYLAEQKCDLVIWETGLGGRLDATNIVTPFASVITNIAYDHQQWLGHTLAEIAAEKAGIIKPGVPVVTAVEAPEALAVIQAVAREKSAPLTAVDSQRASRLTSHASLLGEHQRLNAALAVATVGVLQRQLPVSEEAVCLGLKSVHWPGRLQLVTRPNGQRLLLDGAHNVAGAEALRAALRSGAPVSDPAQRGARSKHAGSETGAPLRLILGILADKDCRAMCEILAPLATRILLVAVGSARTAKPQELAPFCHAANPQAEVVVCDSLSHALAVSERDPLVVIAGSLYLIGEAMEWLNLSPVPSADEKALNNWQPANPQVKTL
jgi:dihydrofolate synthase/folylpolyglutamate synthase